MRRRKPPPLDIDPAVKDAPLVADVVVEESTEAAETPLAAPPPAPTAIEPVRSTKKAAALLSARARALGSATGFANSECDWSERITFYIETARNPMLEFADRMAAWREIERISKEDFADLLTEKLAAATGDDIWNGLVSAALARRVADNDVEAVKAVINAGRAPDWKPAVETPTTATQINVFNNLPPEKVALLNELDDLMLPKISESPLDVEVVRVKDVVESTDGMDTPVSDEPESA